MKRSRNAGRNSVIAQNVEHRRRLVVAYRLRHKLGAEKIVELLAAEHGIVCTVKNVYADMTHSRNEWKAMRMQAHDQHRDETMAMFDALEAEAWEAWEKSKTARDPVTGLPLKQEGKEVRAPGDWRFLEIVRQTRKDRRDLLGLDAPKMIAGAFAGLNAEDWFRYVKQAMSGTEALPPVPVEALETPPDDDEPLPPS